MLLLLAAIAVATLWSLASAGRRRGRITPWHYRALVALALLVALLVVAAVAIDRGERW